MKFNSLTKTIISNKFQLELAFQKILYNIDAWISKGSGWIIESVQSQYINLQTIISRKFLHRIANGIKAFKKRINKHQKQ